MPFLIVLALGFVLTFLALAVIALILDSIDDTLSKVLDALEQPHTPHADAALGRARKRASLRKA